MAPLNRRDTHPLALLGATPTEIERKTERRVQRPTISLVLNRHRDRLGWAACQFIKEVFPAFDVDTAMNWKWEEHGGLVPFKARVKKKPGAGHAKKAARQ